jgi:hypothetical protein
MQRMIRQDWPADLSIGGYRNPRRSSMVNQSAIEKRSEFFSRTRKKFKSLSVIFSSRKRTSKYTCAGGLNRLRKAAQEQIPRGKKRSSFGSPVWLMTLIVSLQPEFRLCRDSLRLTVTQHLRAGRANTVAARPECRRRTSSPGLAEPSFPSEQS